MAVTEQKSTQVSATRKKIYENLTKLRYAYFDHTQSGAGDATSTVELVKLPAGHVRVLPNMCRVEHSALGASRTLDVGHAAYEKNAAGDLEAEDLNAIVDGIDVSSAGAGVALGTALKYDMFSRRGITLKAQINDGTIPDAATLKGQIVYVTE